MKPLPKVSVLISESEIRARIHALAAEISGVMPKDVLVVALLRGSYVFAADLLRALHASGSRPQVDFMTVSSYGDKTESSGTLTVHRDMTSEVQGREILLIDDILESGRTLFHARAEIAKRGAKNIRVAVLLEKPGKRVMEVHADYVGFTIPDKFVVGYGLDYANYYRELPYIGVVEMSS
jgi:hypoxanthine phosphoribosyltransferase